MMNKKKMIIISIAMILLIGSLVGCFFIVKGIFKDKENKLDTNVVSMITLDINPSIKIELNKDNLVINVISLNDDGKEIIDDNYLGKNLDDVVNSIIDNLVDKGYAKEELVILVGFTGDIKEDLAIDIINDKLNTLDIQYNIIIPEISETSQELAKEYNITESKAAYLEDIIENNDVKIDDIKDMSVKDIEDMVRKKNESEITEKEDNKNKESKTEKTTTSVNKTVEKNKNTGGTGALKKCEHVNSVLTNEEAGKKVASLMGASVGTGKYCDKLPPESVAALASDGTCAYKVSFAHRTKSCVYYIGMESGDVLGNPNCTSKLVGEGEAQCIIMDSLGITAREKFYASNTRDNGSEWIYDVEDVYGTPDENGKRYIYEYHVSKSTGQITSKTVISELQ